MSLELPVLRLGLAGFSADEQERVSGQLKRLSPAQLSWQCTSFAEADAWWVHGGRTQFLPDGTLRIAPGVPSARSVQLSLPEVDRPVAFSLPLAPSVVEPSYTFDLRAPDSMAAMLQKFSGWLQPVVAQFCLAASILQHQTALGSGTFHVLSEGRLIAVVDMRGAIGLHPAAGPMEFEDADWHRRPDAAGTAPESFLRTDLSQIMWQYAQRTRKDVLPAHYRKVPLFFRRPPRLAQRLMKDAHLLLLRELANGPGTFEELQVRTGLVDEQMARHLQALYLVGSITSNPKRAAASAMRRPEQADSLLSRPHSVPPSNFDSAPQALLGGRRPPAGDMTAPAPLLPS
jgi:hypothetical protein